MSWYDARIEQRWRLTLLGYENYYPGGSKGCVYTLKRKELRHTLAPQTRRLFHFLFLP